MLPAQLQPTIPPFHFLDQTGSSQTPLACDHTSIAGSPETAFCLCTSPLRLQPLLPRQARHYSPSPDTVKPGSSLHLSDPEDTSQHLACLWILELQRRRLLVCTKPSFLPAFSGSSSGLSSPHAGATSRELAQLRPRLTFRQPLGKLLGPSVTSKLPQGSKKSPAPSWTSQSSCFVASSSLSLSLATPQTRRRLASQT